MGIFGICVGKALHFPYGLHGSGEQKKSLPLSLGDG